MAKIMLKTCPHDGSGDVRIGMFDDDGRSHEYYFGLCNVCGAKGPEADTEEEAATLWNKRADDPPVASAKIEHVMRDRAAKLFKPPFKFVNDTYILDAEGHMLADNRVPEGAILQVRGWGHLVGRGALALPAEEAAALQRAYGELIAEALTAHWNS